MRLNIRLLASLKTKRPFYITTPIFYANASPHIGHLYTAVLADSIQRFEKLTNPHYNVVLSTGTDEHGTKIQQAAAAARLDPAQYTTKLAEEYRRLFKEYNVDYTDFIRTTEERHKKAVHAFWNRLVEKDHIYKAQYSGWYSVNDETFVPEAHTKDDTINGEKVKISLESGHKVEWTDETNYMFRLSAFKTHLQRWLRQDGVVQPEKFQKQLQDMVADDVYLPDISVSRPAARVHWAIRVPGDEEQSIYVWMDALVNYLTVTGYPDDEEVRARGRLWPADLQLLGKDILKFHGLYWPAFLMAASYHPPRRLLCHSHWTVDGVKMSKSLGNVVTPQTAKAQHDALRYLLLREHTLHSDANFSETKLVNTVNAELADTLGNLLSRCCGTALNPRAQYPGLNQDELVQARQASEVGNLLVAVERLPDHCREYYSTYQLHKAVDSIIHTLHLANQFFESQKPWEHAKKPENQTKLDLILHLTMETLRVCGILLQPIIPSLSSKLLDRLNVSKEERDWVHSELVSWNSDGVSESRGIESGKFVLFQRIYQDKDKKLGRKIVNS